MIILSICKKFSHHRRCRHLPQGIKHLSTSLPCVSLVLLHLWSNWLTYSWTTYHNMLNYQNYKRKNKIFPSPTLVSVFGQAWLFHYTYCVISQYLRDYSHDNLLSHYLVDLLEIFFLKLNLDSVN